MADDLSASLAKDLDARIASIDEGVTHIILMADTISTAVVNNFRNSLKKKHDGFRVTGTVRTIGACHLPPATLSLVE